MSLRIFSRRGLRSLEVWKTRPAQKPPDLPMSYNLRLLASSMWTRRASESGYRSGAYWSYLGNADSQVLEQSREVVDGLHGAALRAPFSSIYAREVADELDGDCVALQEGSGAAAPPELMPAI